MKFGMSSGARSKHCLHPTIELYPWSSSAAWPSGKGPAGFFFDFQQAVVLCQTLRLPDRSILKLIGPPTHGQICRPVVLGFAAANAKRDRPTCRPRLSVGLKCFG